MSDAVPEVPRRKGLGKKQLAWLRKNVPQFAELEARALASKGGTLPIGGKAGK